jgi:hypothetical protein
MATISTSYDAYIEWGTEKSSIRGRGIVCREGKIPAREDKTWIGANGDLASKSAGLRRGRLLFFPHRLDHFLGVFLGHRSLTRMELFPVLFCRFP